MSSNRRFSLRQTRSRKSEETSPETSPTVSTIPLFKHKRILLPYDGSEEAQRALHYVAEVFQSGDHVVLAYVMQPNSPRSALLTLDDAEPDKPPQKVAMDALERACAPLERKGISNTCQVYLGDPKTSVQGLIDFHHCDTVVVGRRKVSKKGMLGQRFSNYIMENTSANVIAVR